MIFKFISLARLLWSPDVYPYPTAILTAKSWTPTTDIMIFNPLAALLPSVPYLAKMQFHFSNCSGQKPWSLPWLLLFSVMSHSTASANPISSAFTMYPESDPFSLPPLPPFWLSHTWVIKLTSYLIFTISSLQSSPHTVAMVILYNTWAVVPVVYSESVRDAWLCYPEYGLTCLYHTCKALVFSAYCFSNSVPSPHTIPAMLSLCLVSNKQYRQQPHQDLCLFLLSKKNFSQISAWPTFFFQVIAWIHLIEEDFTDPLYKITLPVWPSY